MNLEDFARINRILTSFEPQTPSIKIFNSKRRSSAVEDFRRDLKFFSSHGGYGEVSRVLICGECFFEIQLKDNSTPYIYYFTGCFGDVSQTFDEIKEICDDFNVPFEVLDERLI